MPLGATFAVVLEGIMMAVVTSCPSSIATLDVTLAIAEDGAVTLSTGTMIGVVAISIALDDSTNNSAAGCTAKVTDLKFDWIGPARRKTTCAGAPLVLAGTV